MWKCKKCGSTKFKIIEIRETEFEVTFDKEGIEDENFKNLPIGNTFVFGLVTLKVVKATKELSCKKCWVGIYIPERCGSDIIPYCIGKKRKDKTNVIFAEVK